MCYSFVMQCINLSSANQIKSIMIRPFFVFFPAMQNVLLFYGWQLYSTVYTHHTVLHIHNPYILYDIPSRYVSIYVPICIFKSLVGKRIEVSSHLQRYLLSFGEKILRDYTLPKKYYFGTKIWLIIVFFHSSTTWTNSKHFRLLF